MLKITKIFEKTFYSVWIISVAVFFSCNKKLDISETESNNTNKKDLEFVSSIIKNSNEDLKFYRYPLVRLGENPSCVISANEVPIVYVEKEEFVSDIKSGGEGGPTWHEIQINEEIVEEIFKNCSSAFQEIKSQNYFIAAGTFQTKTVVIKTEAQPAPNTKPAELPNQSGLATNLNREKANGLANNALSRAGKQSQGKCWLYVNNALMGSGWKRMGMSAKIFADMGEAYAKKEFGLCRLKNSSGKLDNFTGRAPIGSIIGYAPGLYGFSSKWGHGEVKVSENKYCSDFCRTLKAPITASYIWYPCQ